jgi:hypothetical protein
MARFDVLFLAPSAAGLVVAAVIAAHGQSPSSNGGATLFPTIASVLKSPRCQNCHTSTDFPRQGDDRHRHRLNVMRGVGDHGAPGMACMTCHGASNNPSSGVPGAPNWGIAPVGQQWETFDVAALCRQLTDPRHNGGRSIAQLEEHMTGDPLVQWAWHPGRDAKGRPRGLPPVGQEDFHALVHHWVASGARCPA